jgi:hypothetical protein
VQGPEAVPALSPLVPATTLPHAPQGLDVGAITQLLDSCLLTDAELGAGRSALEWLLDDPLLGPDDDGDDAAGGGAGFEFELE